MGPIPGPLAIGPSYTRQEGARMGQRLVVWQTARSEFRLWRWRQKKNKSASEVFPRVRAYMSKKNK